MKRSQQKHGPVLRRLLVLPTAGGCRAFLPARRNVDRKLFCSHEQSCVLGVMVLKPSGTLRLRNVCKPALLLQHSTLACQQMRACTGAGTPNRRCFRYVRLPVARTVQFKRDALSARAQMVQFLLQMIPCSEDWRWIQTAAVTLPCLPRKTSALGRSHAWNFIGRLRRFRTRAQTRVSAVRVSE